jgi:RND family efflux transporter MFP subunit
LYQSQIDAALAAMQQVQKQINDLTIEAPQGGIVVRTNGNVGEVATPATAVVSLIPTAALQVKLNVSEDNITNVSSVQTVTMTLDALGDQTKLTGKVIAIEPAGTIIGGAVYYKTTVALDRADNRIRPDMTVNAQIETAVHDNSLVIPVSALQTSGGKTTVQVLIGKKAIQKDVTRGIESQDGMVEIISGLAQNDQVILGTK